MAQLVPSLSTCLAKMTSGEKRLGKRLESHLEDDYLCWYDIPVGRRNRYPDFMILHPSRGLLFLEVKDWKLDTIKKVSKSQVELLTNNGRVTTPNPVEQVRQYAYQVVNLLQADPALVASSGSYHGKLKFPYGYGVVFSNITRAQLDEALTDEGTHVLPGHMLICKDEMTESVEPEFFQERLWSMFNTSFGHSLSLPEIERIRWHLFPELRIDSAQVEIDLGEDDITPKDTTIPEIIRVMDLQQEQLARNLGMGHRVIHGVAGSGKTMILGFRALQFAELTGKPILVLCFNVTLAAKLRHFASERGISEQVQVYHFHDWCGQQLRMYHCDTPAGENPFWERQVLGVIRGVEQARIPRGQYGAIMIDEGHDFEPEWLQLITQMVDPDTDSLLLLYDDAQSIYRKKGGLDFTLASVGIKARGRTTVLKLNYRNSKEILAYAFRFAEEFISAEETTESDIPLIRPESAGGSGPEPVFRQFTEVNEEHRFILACAKKWLDTFGDSQEIAVLAPSNAVAEAISKQMQEKDIPHICLTGRDAKSGYVPDANKITILTIHSSKGLEFDRVMLASIDKLQHVSRELADQVRLLYVGMTRARSHLLLTCSNSTSFTERLVEMMAP